MMNKKYVARYAIWRITSMESHKAMQKPMLVALKLLYLLLTVTAGMLMITYLASIPAQTPDTSSAFSGGRVAGVSAPEEEQKTMLDQVMEEGGELFMVSAALSAGFLVFVIITPGIRSSLKRVR